MSQLNNTMAIFKLLDKSNCMKCNEATCLAFAAAVFKGQKKLDECPSLERDIIERFEGQTVKRTTIEQDMDESVEQLKRTIASIDLSSSAQRLGAKFSDDKLTIKIFGKDFSIDSMGNLSSDIHIHPWVAMLEGRNLIHKTTHQTYAQLGVTPLQPQKRGDPSDHLVLGALTDDAGIEQDQISGLGSIRLVEANPPQFLLRLARVCKVNLAANRPEIVVHRGTRRNPVSQGGFPPHLHR